MTLPLNVLWCSLFLQGMWRVVFVVDALVCARAGVRVERVARLKYIKKFCIFFIFF